VFFWSFGIVPKAFIAQICVFTVWHIFRCGHIVKGCTEIKEITYAFVHEIPLRILRIFSQYFEDKSWHGFRDKFVLNL
jgi:hypothetical protein